MATLKQLLTNLAVMDKMSLYGEGGWVTGLPAWSLLERRRLPSNVRTRSGQQSEAYSEKPKNDPFEPGSDQSQSGNDKKEPDVHPEKSERPEHHY
jgi:hypothetical protein